MRKILLLFVCALFCACKSESVPQDIVIEGNVRGIPDGKVYLVNAFRVYDVRDSADCVGGTFKFVIRPDSSFVPYMASIVGGSLSDPKARKQFLFGNHMKGAGSTRNSVGSFYVERGLTKISGDNDQAPYLRVSAGAETDLMFAKGLAFGGPGGKTAAERQSAIDRTASEIRKHPESFHLLQMLFFNKTYYTEPELKELVALFDDDVRTSKLGEEFRTYFTNRLNPGEAFPNMSFYGPDGKRRPVIDPEAKLNMLVFWSSWCGPCRREIPVFKEIEQGYRGRGLNMVSISIDEYKDRWTKALSEEKMVWPQFIADADKISYLQETFNFVGVPLVVFTDNHGVEIARFDGNREGHKKKYQELIDRYVLREM